MQARTAPCTCTQTRVEVLKLEKNVQTSRKVLCSEMLARLKKIIDFRWFFLSLIEDRSQSLSSLSLSSGFQPI